MKANRSLGLLEKSREGDLILSFQLCSDCEIHTIAPFSLKGGRRGAAAARPAISWARRGRVHCGDKGGAAPGLVGRRVSHPTEAAAPFSGCIPRRLLLRSPWPGCRACQVRRPVVPSARPPRSVPAAGWVHSQDYGRREEPSGGPPWASPGAWPHPAWPVRLPQ